MPVKAVSELEEFRTIVRLLATPYSQLLKNLFLCCRDARVRARMQISQDKYTVFDFWAQWCGPCKVISPIFEKLSEQFTGVEFYKVDVDAAEAISQELSIRAVRIPTLSFFLSFFPKWYAEVLRDWGGQMPTFILFKNGEKVKEVVGANPAALQVRALTLNTRHL